MNVKKAKALRKLVGFKPKDERKYVPLQIWNALGKGSTTVKTTKVNSEDSPRGRYLELKRLSNDR